MPEDKNTGPRSFVVFLRDLAEGEAEGLLSHEFHELMKRLHEEAKTRVAKVKGGIKLKLNVTVDEAQHVMITYDVVATVPPRKTSMSAFYVDNHSRLTKDDPKQTKLPLRDISREREVREIEPKAQQEKEI